jgi:aspartate aminotransferase
VKVAEDAANGLVEPDARGQLSDRVAHTLVASRESWTRRMFELAVQLRSTDGAPVFDLSLGNPSLEPPLLWRDAVVALLQEEPAGMHRYMTNAGFPEVRAFVAERESARYGLPFAPTDVTMTVGAAGGLNVLARATLDPGDEVMVPLPFFSEYEHYCANVGARLVPVASRADFSLDLDAIERALGPRTRWLLLNSPNNPTGAVYGDDELEALTRLLADDARRRSRPVLVLEDAPYRDLVYDASAVPSMLGRWPHTVLVTSHSKDLGLAGERIGYLVVSPTAFGRDGLVRAAAYCTRVLGFVNAPALMQRVLPLVLSDPRGRVDVEVYARNCRRMAAGLRALGFGLPEPRAGFFLFPSLPDRFPDDVALTEQLVAERTIVVPGTAFGVPGHLRMSLAVDDATVDGALAAFQRVCA